MKKTIATAAIAAVAAVVLALPASAAPRPAPPNGPRPTPGTPAQVCAYLTGTPAVQAYIRTAYAGYGIDTFSGCVRTFAKGTPVVLDEVNEPDGFGGDATAQCAELERSFGLTYPFVFEEPPELGLPLFKGSNRAECSRILFTLHAAGVALLGGG